MRLDCETPRGKIFISHQIRTQEILENLGYSITSFPKKDAHADVVISKDVDGVRVISGVAEIKSRESAAGVPLTREYLSRNGGYLITEEKITYGRELSRVAGVPYFVIVNLLSENVILVWKITDHDGNVVLDYVTRETVTRATCNGGTATRVNAYLPIEKSYCIEY